MKRTCVLFGVVCFIAPAAWAGDLNPPDWRGVPGSAFWHGSFAAGLCSPLFPDGADNPYGTPEYDSPYRDDEWLSTNEGRTSVLDAFDWEQLRIRLPNQAMENGLQDIVLEVVRPWDGPPGYEWDIPPAVVDSQHSVDLFGNGTMAGSLTT